MQQYYHNDYLSSRDNRRPQCTEVMKTLRGGVELDEDQIMQVGVHLAEMVKLDILECSGTGRIAIYTKL